MTKPTALIPWTPGTNCHKEMAYALKALEKDADWQNLLDFDIEIERTGQDMQNTRYNVVPKPKSELSKDCEKAVKEGLPVLDALYLGKDPFNFNPDAVDEKVDCDKLPF